MDRVQMTIDEALKVMRGEKTQFRVIVKQSHRVQMHHGRLYLAQPQNESMFSEPLVCPYKPGTKLWVQEPWRINRLLIQGADRINEVEYACGEVRQFKNAVLHPDADYILTMIEWQPPENMPAAFSRLQLVVDSCEPQRLNEISFEECHEEGHPGDRCACDSFAFGLCTDCLGSGWGEPPIVGFIDAWDSKHSGAERWDANPWVWVIEFRRALHDVASLLQRLWTNAVDSPHYEKSEWKLLQKVIWKTGIARKDLDLFHD